MCKCLTVGERKAWSEACRDAWAAPSLQPVCSKACMGKGSPMCKLLIGLTCAGTQQAGTCGWLSLQVGLGRWAGLPPGLPACLHSAHGAWAPIHSSPLGLAGSTGHELQTQNPFRHFCPKPVHQAAPWCWHTCSLTSCLWYPAFPTLPPPLCALAAAAATTVYPRQPRGQAASWASVMLRGSV